jgi:hypothetical protein
MSTNVLPFPSSDLTDFAEIPQPATAQPGETFLRIDVTGNLYGHMCLLPGAVLVALVGSLREGWPHLFEWHRRLLAGRILEITDAHIHVVHWEPGAELKTYPRDSIKVVGAIVETYPAGLRGPRWVCHGPTAVAVPTSMAYPLVSIVGQ